MTAGGDDDMAGTFAERWVQYWAGHPELHQWHAATYRRRATAAAFAAKMASAAESSATTTPQDLDPQFFAPVAPCDGGQVVVRADIAAASAAADSRPQVEMMFAAVARRAVVAAASFVVDENTTTTTTTTGRDKDACSSVATFRAQLCSGDVVLEVARELAVVVAVEIEPGYAAVAPHRLILRGATLAALVRAVPIAELAQLFAVFGECDVAYPDEASVAALESAVAAAANGTGDCVLPRSAVTAAAHDLCPVISVVYTASKYAEDPMLVADAAAALRSLQLWLAYDWGIIATYDAVPPDAAAAAAVGDDDGDDEDVVGGGDRTALASPSKSAAGGGDDEGAAWPAEGKRGRDDCETNNDDDAVAAAAAAGTDAAATQEGADGSEEGEGTQARPLLRRAVRGAPVI